MNHRYCECYGQASDEDTGFFRSNGPTTLLRMHLGLVYQKHIGTSPYAAMSCRCAMVRPGGDAQAPSVSV